jgi:hypothetical protein
MGRTLVPQLLTAPAAYPVSLAEAKAALSFATDVPDDDARLAGLIAGATAQVEAWLGMALITRQYHGFMDRWPHRREGAHDFGEWPAEVGAPGATNAWLARRVEIPRPPLISIDAVVTYDDTDTPTTMDPSTYFVDTDSIFGRLCLRNGQQWPIPMRTANGIEITWTCGVGPTLRPFLDEDIRTGILIAVGALNEQRGDIPAPDELPAAAKALLSARRLTWL